MPTDLAAMIPPGDRQSCRETMTGFINYTIDRGEAQERLARCLAQALAELSTKKGATAAKLRADALAFRRANSWTKMSGDEMSAVRDRAMADQLGSFRRELKPGIKVIVWTANGHAAEGGLPTGKTLAQITRERIGSRLFTVGSSAAAGEFRWTTTEIRPVPVSSPGQLEYTILRGRTEAVAARSELRKLGKITGTALSWHKPTTEDWSTLFDAIYVLAREKPTTLTVQ
jgi:erythromycin esterase-like protein